MTDRPLSADICGHPDCKGNGKYVVKAQCSNCAWRGEIEITKGHKFSNARACPKCACRWTLMQRFS